jgi:hypothetical protein
MARISTMKAEPQKPTVNMLTKVGQKRPAGMAIRMVWVTA